MADNINGIPFSSGDEGRKFTDDAIAYVLINYNEDGIGTRRGEAIEHLTREEVYVVWFAYVLGQWKAILSTSRPDGRIYEVSRRSTGETYVDTYVKTHNVTHH